MVEHTGRFGPVLLRRRPFPMTDTEGPRLLASLRRTVEMLRHVPPQQIARRLQIKVDRRLVSSFPAILGGAQPTAAGRPPQPVLPQRPLLVRHGRGWLFRQPWGKLALSERIDWQLPGADPLTRIWRTNLHYMEFLEGLDDADFVCIVDDWIARCPATASDAWTTGWRAYDMSIRSVVWMQQLARRGPRLPGSFIARALVSLAMQLRCIERHLETDIRGNHLIRNIRALLWGSAFFAGAEADRWRRTGEALLADELDWQILADGCHYERSPSYHCQVFGDMLDIAAVLRAGLLRDRLDATLDRMARVCRWLTHPDGRIALFNDSGFHMAHAPAELLEAHATITGRASAARVAVPSEGSFALRDAGFYGLRLGEDYVVADCGPVGPDDLIGHAHGDVLSFEWTVDGRRIVVDQGTYQYEAGARRDLSRSTASHNTVTIGGAEQCDFFGAHRCGRRARAEVLHYAASPSGFVLEGTHDGFSHLPGRPRHIRCFQAAPGRLVILDRLERADGRIGEAGLLLHPDCRVSRDGERVLVQQGATTVVVESAAPLELEPAEWFPDLHTSRPTRRLRQRFAGGEIETVMEVRR